MAKTVWGASPLSTAANWLEKELFGTREAAKATPIVNVIDLNALTMSTVSFVAGVPATGTIEGWTDGSTITPSGVPSGLSITDRTWAWDGTGSVGSGSFTLSEALDAAENSPRSTTINYEITASALGGLDFSQLSGGGLIALFGDI